MKTKEKHTKRMNKINQYFSILKPNTFQTLRAKQTWSRTTFLSKSGVVSVHGYCTWAYYRYITDHHYTSLSEKGLLLFKIFFVEKADQVLSVTRDKRKPRSITTSSYGNNKNILPVWFIKWKKRTKITSFDIFVLELDA